MVTKRGRTMNCHLVRRAGNGALMGAAFVRVVIEELEAGEVHLISRGRPSSAHEMGSREELGSKYVARTKEVAE